MNHKAQGFTLADYPNVKRWYAEVRARPQVQAGLAIGKFEEEPFDETARRNMFGQAAKEMAGREESSSPPSLRANRSAQSAAPWQGSRSKSQKDCFGATVPAPRS